MTVVIVILLCSLLIFAGVSTAIVIDDVEQTPKMPVPPITSSIVEVEEIGQVEEENQEELEKEGILLCITEEKTDLAEVIWHISIGTGDTKTMEVVQITNSDILSIPVGFNDELPLTQIKGAILEKANLETDEWAVITIKAVDTVLAKLGEVTITVPEETEEQGLHFRKGENELVAEESIAVLTTYFTTEPMQEVKYKMIGEYIKEAKSTEVIELLMLASSCMNETKYSNETEKLEESMNLLSKIKVTDIETTNY